MGLCAQISLLSASTIAKTSVKINGFANISDKNVHNISSNGSVKCVNVNCDGFECNGSADVREMTCNSIKVNGEFAGTNLTVLGPTRVNGSMNVKNGKLQDITISTKESILIDTEVNANINMRQSMRNKQEVEKSVLKLKGNTVVNGDIIFEVDGEVHLDSGVQITGKVERGTLVYDG